LGRGKLTPLLVEVIDLILVVFVAKDSKEQTISIHGDVSQFRLTSNVEQSEFDVLLVELFIGGHVEDSDGGNTSQLLVVDSDGDITLLQENVLRIIKFEILDNRRLEAGVKLDLSKLAAKETVVLILVVSDDFLFGVTDIVVDDSLDGLAGCVIDKFAIDNIRIIDMDKILEASAIGELGSQLVDLGKREGDG